MTRERREEVVLVALVLSVAVHLALMLLARSQVMTRVSVSSDKVTRRPVMRVVKRNARPDPVRLAAVEDTAPRKDAPAVAEAASAPIETAPSAEIFKAEVPKAAIPEPRAPEKAAATVFEAKPVGQEKTVAVPPVLTIETPAAVPAPDPAFTVAATPLSSPVLPSVAAEAKMPVVGLESAKISGATAPKGAYLPPSEVYAEVDEKVVAEEKAAVRALIGAADAAELKPFVNVTMTSAVAGDWRYFKVRVVPRKALKVVPKDVVLVIDGSGSIGKDRFGSCRAAARRILRTVTNTGDRFNLVVFRNAFSYAFRSWRDCDAPSFEAGDRWLQKQTAHGRTDVFSTISSLLTLPRDPTRPLVALVVTDGDANAGVSDTAEILSKFTALNDGLVSVYMYGVKSSANRELIDVLTHANRGESLTFEGWRWNAGEGLEGLSERFRDPVLSDLRLVFTTGTRAEAYPRLLRNLHRNDTLSFVGRVPAATKEVAFSLRGLNGKDALEGFFRLPLAVAPAEPGLVAEWNAEQAIDRKLTAR